MTRGALDNVFKEYISSAQQAGGLTDTLKNKISSLSGTSVSLRKYLESLNGSTDATLSGYIKYLTSAEAGTIKLRAATIAMNAVLAVGTTLAITAVTSLISRWSAEVEEARQEAIRTAESVHEIATSLSDISNQYRELYQARGDTWDESAISTVRNLQQQIVDLVGDQCDGIDLVNGRLEDQLKLLKNISVENAQGWIRDNRGAIKNATAFIERENRGGLLPGVGQTQGMLSLYTGNYLLADNRIRKWLNDNLSNYGFSASGPMNFMYSITGTADELIDTYTKLYDDLSEYAQSAGIDAENVLVDISNRLHAIGNDTYGEYRQIYESWLQNEAIVSQADVLRNGFADQAAFDEYIANLRNATGGNKELNAAMIEVVQNAFPEFAQAASDAADGAEKQASGLDYLLKKYKKLLNQNAKLSKLGNVQLTLRPQVKMDDGSVATVLTTNNDYIASVTDEDTGVRFGQNVIIHYTPILPDGTVWSDEEAAQYIQRLVDRYSLDELLEKDAESQKLILKIDTDLDFSLDDKQKDKLWNAIGDSYDELSDVYANGGLQKLTEQIAEDMQSAGVPLEEAAKYLASLFDADRWDFDLHTLQEQFYSLIEKEYDTGRSLMDLLLTSDTAWEALASDLPSAIWESLLNGDMGSAKDFTPYLDAVDEISKLQKQLTDAQKEMLDGGTISSGTAADIYTALTNAGANYLDYLTVEGDQIKLNTEAYKEFIQQQIYEKNGVMDLTRTLAEEFALQEQYADAMQDASESGGESDEAARIRSQLEELEAEYGTVEELKNAITQLEAIFNVSFEENGLKSGIEGLGEALDATEPKATELERAIQSLEQSRNLDALTQMDFSNLLTQFPKLKRWLDAYNKGQITATRLLGVFQNALNQFNTGSVFDDLATAKDSISALGKVVNDLKEGKGVSFSTLSAIQEAFSGVDGIEDYIQHLKEAKTSTEEVSNIIGTLLYQSLAEATGSTQDLANADEVLIASMLREAGVADAAAAAHQAVERAKQDSAIASNAAKAATTDDIEALYDECVALGMTKDAIYQVVSTQIIFSNTKMDVSQKIAALNQLAQMCGVTIGYVNGVANSISGLAGANTSDINRTIDGLVRTGQAANKTAAAQMLLSRAYNTQFAAATNPFKGVDFSSLGSSSGGGGTAKTKAEEIKSAFDDLNTVMEHSIYLEQQYYNVADSEYDYDGMKQALQNQVGYYKQVQAAAESAMEQVRAYYRSKGMSDAVIEQQSEIQALQKAWWEAANSIDESLDKIATAIRDKLSKEVDDIQSAWSSLQKAAEEYSSTGVISIDSLQAIISAGVEYVSLLKDENGQLVLNEDAVSAVLEAKTQQLAVESALSYIEQVRNALMQNNVTELNRLLDVTSVAASSTWDLVYAQAALLNLNGNQYNQLISNINKFRSIATTTVSTVRKQVRNSVQNETKDYKSALDDVLKLVEDLIKYEHEQMVDSLEQQRDLYTELIQKKKDLLQQTKDEEDYESNVSKKLKEISRIQDQINRLSLDDSREAAAKRASLEEELADLQEDLASYIGDYTSSKNEETLDKAAEDYSQYIDDRIQMVEEEVSSEEKIYRLA